MILYVFLYCLFTSIAQFISSPFTSKAIRVNPIAVAVYIYIYIDMNIWNWRACNATVYTYQYHFFHIFAIVLFCFYLIYFMCVCVFALYDLFLARIVISECVPREEEQLKKKRKRCKKNGKNRRHTKNSRRISKEIVAWANRTRRQNRYFASMQYRNRSTMNA